jgi:subtilisin-like proprotein convertase family protein
MLKQPTREPSIYYSLLLMAHSYPLATETVRVALISSTPVFSPDATNPISSGTAPFSGDFQPDGAWNTLDGAPLNGDWQLVVINNQPNNGSGQIISWTITFQIEK